MEIGENGWKYGGNRAANYWWYPTQRLLWNVEKINANLVVNSDWNQWKCTKNTADGGNGWKCGGSWWKCGENT